MAWIRLLSGLVSEMELEHTAKLQVRARTTWHDIEVAAMNAGIPDQATVEVKQESAYPGEFGTGGSWIIFTWKG